jgi:hypothetical protein
MTITKRLVKGSALTHAELDENFRDLDERARRMPSGSKTITTAGRPSRSTTAPTPS